MCISKANGGMGFQNLRAFNQTMLAKQAWRILSNPTSLVAQVLKSKFFPTGDVLNAKLGSSPSYSWRSIHSSLEVIKNGTQWRVGNGKLIHIQDDRWLPTPSTYMVISPPNSSPEFPMISTLIDPITEWWNVNLVRATFLPFEADTIPRIPLSHSMSKDKVIWLGNSQGEFTLKSAYHIAHNLIEAKKVGECPSGDHINHYGRDFGILIFLPRSRFLPEGFVPMDSPPQKLFAAKELATIAAVQFVKKTLKVLTMPSSATTSPPSSGINGLKIPQAFKRSGGLSQTQPCPSSPATLSKTQNFSLELLGPFGTTGIRQSMQKAASPTSKFGNWLRVWWRTLAMLLTGTSPNQDLFLSNGTPHPQESSR